MNDTPTPRTKEIWGAMLYTYPFLINCVTETGEMEVELTAAREELKAVTIERDEFHVKIEELAIKLQAVTEAMSQPPKLFTLSAYPDVPEQLVKIMEEEINKHLQPYQAEILNHIQEKGRNLILWGTSTPPLL